MSVALIEYGSLFQLRNIRLQYIHIDKLFEFDEISPVCFPSIPEAMMAEEQIEFPTTTVTEPVEDGENVNTADEVN